MRSLRTILLAAAWPVAALAAAPSAPVAPSASSTGSLPSLLVLAVVPRPAAPAEARRATVWLHDALAATGRFALVDPPVVPPGRRAPEDCLEPGCVAARGRAAGARLVVIAALGKLKTDWACSARLVDAASARVLGSVTVRSDALEGIQAGLPGAAGRLAEKARAGKPGAGIATGRGPS